MYEHENYIYCTLLEYMGKISFLNRKNIKRITTDEINNIIAKRRFTSRSSYVTYCYKNIKSLMNQLYVVLGHCEFSK